MKVIHILSGLYQGGAESQLEKLIYFSSDQNVEHIVVSLKSDKTPLMERFRDSNIEVHGLGFSGLSSLLGFLKLCKLLKENDEPTMVIQCWMYHANFFGLLAAIFTGLSKKVVWNIRRTELPLGCTGILSKISAKLSYVFTVNIVCCANSARISHAVSGYNENNMKVIHNGIDVSLYRPDDGRRRTFRNEISVINEEFVIGMVGRYDPIKGHVYLLEIFRTLTKKLKGTSKRVRLVLVGRDIENVKELQVFFADINLIGHITLVPERADIYNVMPGFDLLCLPSKSEGFPNVVAEAMASGVPTFVTGVGDAAYIVGTRSMVIPRNNADIVADKLLKFIFLTEEDRSILGSDARTRIVQNFSIERAWGQYSTLFNQIIEKSN